MDEGNIHIISPGQFISSADTLCVHKTTRGGNFFGGYSISRHRQFTFARSIGDECRHFYSDGPLTVQVNNEWPRRRRLRCRATENSGVQGRPPQLRPWRNIPHSYLFFSSTFSVLPFLIRFGVSPRENFEIKGACRWVLEHFRHKHQHIFTFVFLSSLFPPPRISMTHFAAPRGAFGRPAGVYSCRHSWNKTETKLKQNSLKSCLKTVLFVSVLFQLCGQFNECGRPRCNSVEFFFRVEQRYNIYRHWRRTLLWEELQSCHDDELNILTTVSNIKTENAMYAMHSMVVFVVLYRLVQKVNPLRIINISY